ncbi:aldo/keto reductase [Nonomuraea angiospora]
MSQESKPAAIAGRLQPADGLSVNRLATRTQIALAWLLAVSPATLLIPGTKSVAHLEENLGAGVIELTEDDIAELDKFA